jgi:hypothetical protein
MELIKMGRISEWQESGDLAIAETFAVRIDRNDFTFVIGSCNLPCGQFQAAYWSPFVAIAFENDPMIDQFVIEEIDCHERNPCGGHTVLRRGSISFGASLTD